MSDLRLIYEPSVYLVGVQKVDPDGMQRFLADNGTPDWTTDAESAAEALIETAGEIS